ncbi:MAG: hypothetical protein WBW61_12865 [Rhodanobacteraceae bacterium]
MPNYTIRCNKTGSTTPYALSIFDATGQVINGPIDVNTKTDFELKVDEGASAPETKGFTINVTPDQPGQIQPLIGQKTQTINFTDQCTQSCMINMNLSAYVPGNPAPIIAGPKPVIRNSPRGPQFRLKLIVGITLALVALAVIAYYMYFR